MFEQLKVWIETFLGSEYQYSFGPWDENESVNFICAIYGAGGSPVEMDVRRPRFKILLVGPKNEKKHASKIMNDLDKLIQSAIELQPPCGAAHIRALTEPQGPAYTTENRAWASVDFQLIY